MSRSMRRWLRFVPASSSKTCHSVSGHRSSLMAFRTVVEVYTFIQQTRLSSWYNSSRFVSSSSSTFWTTWKRSISSNRHNRIWRKQPAARVWLQAMTTLCPSLHNRFAPSSKRCSTVKSSVSIICSSLRQAPRLHPRPIHMIRCSVSISRRSSPFWTAPKYRPRVSATWLSPEVKRSQVTSLRRLFRSRTNLFSRSRRSRAHRPSLTLLPTPACSWNRLSTVSFIKANSPRRQKALKNTSPLDRRSSRETRIPYPLISRKCKFVLSWTKQSSGPVISRKRPEVL